MNEKDLVKSILLELEIKKAIMLIDDSLSINVFANVIGNILSEQYGEHNYDKFLTGLNNHLKN